MITDQSTGIQFNHLPLEKWLLDRIIYFESAKEFFQDTFLCNFIHYNVRLQYHLTRDKIPVRKYWYSEEQIKRIVYIQAKCRGCKARELYKRLQERKYQSREHEILFKRHLIFNFQCVTLFGIILKERNKFLLKTSVINEGIKELIIPLGENYLRQLYDTFTYDFNTKILIKYDWKQKNFELIEQC